MVTDTEISALEDRIRTLLKSHRCHLVNPAHLALEAREYREASSYFDIERNAVVAEPFFHYVVAEDVAIFLVDGEPFSIYVFACRPHDLITYVDGNLTHADVEQCQHYLSKVLGQCANITLPAELAYRWIDEQLG